MPRALLPGRWSADRSRAEPDVTSELIDLPPPIVRCRPDVLAAMRRPITTQHIEHEAYHVPLRRRLARTLRALWVWLCQVEA